MPLSELQPNTYEAPTRQELKDSLRERSSR